MAAGGQHLHQVLSFAGALEFLHALAQETSVTGYLESELYELMEGSGISSPQTAMADLSSANLLISYGDRVMLSRRGETSLLLLQALNGADLKETYARLAQLDPSLHNYELVREGMTRMFLENLNDRPGFGRLYVCSPWLNLDPRQRALLVNGVHLAERAGHAVEIQVITRPDPKKADGLPSGVEPFSQLGAKILLNRRLHTKLYIREPDWLGGYSMAIVGSQNLTRSNYLELGIRVNSDSTMISQLVRYFWDIANTSTDG